MSTPPSPLNNTTPVYGFPGPELDDDADGPSQILALAQAVEDVLTIGPLQMTNGVIEAATPTEPTHPVTLGHIARADTSAVRNTDVTVTAGDYGVLAGPATIGDAPPGLYLVGVTGSVARTGGSGTAILLNLQVNGINIQTTVVETNDDFRRNIHLSMLHNHTTSGTLQVQCTAAGTLAGIRLHTGSRVWAARISV